MAASAESDPPIRTRLRVLILASWYPDAGTEHAGIFVQQQADALAARCEVAVLHVHRGGDSSAPRFVREGAVAVVRATLPLIPEPSTPLDNLRTLWRITMGYRRTVLRAFELLQSEWGRPDIIHVHAAFPAAVGARALSRKFGIPYVVTEHQADYLPESPGFAASGGRLLPTMVKHAMRRSSAMIAVSSHLGRALAAGGYHDSPVVIPNIVQGVEQPLPHRGPLGGPPRAVHVSLMRAFEKNIPMLLEALHLLDRRGISLEFTLVGDGPDRDEMQRLADSGAFGAVHVHFAGAVQHKALRALYGCSDFSVVSSRYETFCLAAAESIAAGCPVVSTRCGGPEDFIDSRVGLLVDNEDAGALADGIAWMLAHSGEYDRAAMREYAIERFSPESVVSQIVGVYEGILGPKGRRERATHNAFRKQGGRVS